MRHSFTYQVQDTNRPKEKTANPAVFSYEKPFKNGFASFSSSGVVEGP
jgi:hypothetical protein